jgi:tetratricopeptide (TPR) repeat protein
LIAHHVAVRRVLRGFTSLVIALWLVGCASSNGAWRSSQADLPRRAEIDSAPFYPQAEKNLCGPESLAIALGAAGIVASVDTLTPQVYLPGREGSLQIEMLAAARRNGAVAVQLASRTDALLREVAAGQPVVVLLNLAFNIAPMWHYAVVIGYDLDAQQIILRSGKERRMQMTMTTFENTWARSEHWGFTVNAPGKLPVTAGDKDVQSALIAFERVAMPKDAALAYSAASERWPANSVLRMGLGNSLHAAGDKPRAAQVYEQLARDKKSGAAWVNLAMTYAELGQKAKAQDAAQQALAAGEPWAARARELLQQMGVTGKGW